MGPLWIDATAGPLPPLYDDTIVLCLDQVDGLWLWLQNYEDVLFADGSPDRLISLQVGPEMFRERSLKPPVVYDKMWRFSRYLNVPEIVQFQQAILTQRSRMPSKPQSWTSKQYLMNLMFAALSAIELAPAGDSVPKEPDDLIGKYFLRFTDLKYPRSDWKAVPVKDKKYPDWRYNGKTGSLLNRSQYQLYEKLGFVGYFPKPSWVLQEQQTELRDATTPRGTTKNFDPRTINASESRIIELIPYHWEKLSDPIFAGDAGVDQRLREKKARAPSSSTAPNISGGATPGTLHGDLPRITCYGFRGDTRDPMGVQAAKGFFCNATRSDVEDPDVKKKVALVDAALEKAKKKHNIETLFEMLLETGVLNLGHVH